jgi:6-phosphogluconolactonase (cycloisomerase 2 family)
MAGDCLGEGVYSFKLQPDGSLAQRKLLRADNPSFVCASDSGEFVYVVHEVKLCACTHARALPVVSSEAWILPPSSTVLMTTTRS